jgi:hypothetical protein
VISIKQLIERDGEKILQATLGRYRSALNAIGESGMQACPSVGSKLHQNLLNLQAALSGDPTAELVEKTGQVVEVGIAQWGSEAAE